MKDEGRRRRLVRVFILPPSYFILPGLVGECSQCGEAVGVSPGGALGSTDAGISSEKTGENPVRRKPKGS